MTLISTDRRDLIKAMYMNAVPAFTVRGMGGTSGKCNYLTMTGHSRNMGQPEEKCSKYVKGKRGRKSGKRKV